MWSRLSAVSKDVFIGAACILQRVGEDGKAPDIEVAARQLAFLVDHLGKFRHCSIIPDKPCRIGDHRTEGIAEDVADKVGRYTENGILKLGTVKPVVVQGRKCRKEQGRLFELVLTDEAFDSTIQGYSLLKALAPRNRTSTAGSRTTP